MLSLNLRFWFSNEYVGFTKNFCQFTLSAGPNSQNKLVSVALTIRVWNSPSQPMLTKAPHRILKLSGCYDEEKAPHAWLRHTPHSRAHKNKTVFFCLGTIQNITQIFALTFQLSFHFFPTTFRTSEQNQSAEEHTTKRFAQLLNRPSGETAL